MRRRCAAASATVRTTLTLAALGFATLGLAGLAATPALAQGNPSVEEMVRSLTPPPPGPLTRGIRVGQPPAAAPAVSLNILFASGSAELTPEAIQTLNDLGRALSDPTLASFRFRLEGHTDTVGGRDYNKALSDRRAITVAEYLAGRFRLDRARLQPIGLGQDGLLVPTPDQTPEPRNRRVLVVNVGS
ncbi:MAG: OmpA family protein [Acetobacteraceae bacterium]